MGVVSNSYLIIFLPLIASLFCQIFHKRSLSFIASLIVVLSIFYLLIESLPQILFHKKISSDLSISLISLNLEFSLDLFNIIFLLSIIFLKIITLLFYYKDIKTFLNDRGGSVFYSVFLLNIFALIGIFTSNNIFNLFLFIEIYSLSYFAIFSLLEDRKSTKLSLNYFCLNIVSSLLLLAVFLVIYLTFNQVNFDQILKAVISRRDALDIWFLPAIFILFFIAIVIKFFPFWLYFKKMKLVNPLADFATIDILFVKTAIGVFLSLKFIRYFFDGDLNFIGFNLDLVLLGLLLLLVIYSSLKLYQQKHLKIIAAYASLNNIAFIFIAVLMQEKQANLAAIFYFLNLILVNLFLFIFAGFLRRYYQSSSMNRIWLVRKNNFLLTMPLGFLFCFIAGFPFTVLFMGNWNLLNVTFGFDYKLLIFAAILFSMIIQLDLAVKLISSFFAKNAVEPKILPFLGMKKYSFYLLSFYLLLAAIFSTSFMLEFFKDFLT